jgi:hypothetical protein
VEFDLTRSQRSGAEPAAGIEGDLRKVQSITAPHEELTLLDGLELARANGSLERFSIGHRDVEQRE